MRVVEWIDEHGYRRRSVLRDDDHDRLAPQGIPQDPPDLGRLDLGFLGFDRNQQKDFRRMLHNELAGRNLVTFQDVEQAGGGVRASIRKILIALGVTDKDVRTKAESRLTRAVVRLYRR